MTFPFRRKIQFYSSKTKPKVMEEVEKMVAGKKYTKAEGESVTGNFVIRTTNRLLLFDIVYFGDVYEFEGKTLVILFVKMRLFIEVLLLVSIAIAVSGIFYVFSEEGLDTFFRLVAFGILCGLFWAVNYLQFGPALNSMKSKLQ